MTSGGKSRRAFIPKSTPMSLLTSPAAVKSWREARLLVERPQVLAGASAVPEIVAQFCRYASSGSSAQTRSDDSPCWRPGMARTEEPRRAAPWAGESFVCSCALASWRSRTRALQHSAPLKQDDREQKLKYQIQKQYNQDGHSAKVEAKYKGYPEGIN